MWVARVLPSLCHEISSCAVLRGSVQRPPEDCLVASCPPDMGATRGGRVSLCLVGPPQKLLQCHTGERPVMQQLMDAPHSGAGPSVPGQPETSPRSGPLSHLPGVNLTEGRSCRAPGSLRSTARAPHLASISLIHCSLSDEGTVICVSWC